jgi:hypothetical protein
MTSVDEVRPMKEALQPATAPPRKRRTTLSRTVSAALEFIAHCALLAVMLLCMRGLEKLMEWLWGPEKVFHVASQSVSLQHMFDGGHIAVFIAILVIGVYATVRTYWFQ